MKERKKILSPHKIVPNLISALLAWTYNFELDDTILLGDKELILNSTKCLKELDESLKQLRQLDKNQTDEYLKFVLKNLIDDGEEDESDVYELIEKSCGEIIAWSLADSTEIVDSEGDVNEDDELYSGIFNNSTKIKELISNINKRNEERREALNQYSQKQST